MIATPIITYLVLGQAIEGLIALQLAHVEPLVRLTLLELPLGDLLGDRPAARILRALLRIDAVRDRVTHVRARQAYAACLGQPPAIVSITNNRDTNGMATVRAGR